MKRSFFLLATLILTFSIQAQVASNSAQMGIKTGLNFTGFEFSETAKNFSIGTVVRPTVGFYGNLPVSKCISIQLEASYSGLGYKLTNAITGEKNQRLNYVSLPVLLKYHAGERFKLLLGAEWDILFGATQKYQAVDNEFVSNKGTLNGDDFAIVGGFEYTLGGRWALQTRYIYGLTEIRKFEPTGSNRALQTAFTYRLGK